APLIARLLGHSGVHEFLRSAAGVDRITSSTRSALRRFAIRSLPAACSPRAVLRSIGAPIELSRSERSLHSQPGTATQLVSIVLVSREARELRFFPPCPRYIYPVPNGIA